MSHSLSDYFALEAGEYLEQLDALLAHGGSPDTERLFRLARGVRGSARVAQEAEIAAVAEGLEAAARAVHERELPWSEEVRSRALRTVDDLKVLVRARGRWGSAEAARAREAMARWEGLHLERGRGRSAEGPGDQLLAFLRREVMGVVSELEHALEDLRRSPGERESLRSLVRRMRPLRGMAGVDSLAPILEVLEGAEDAVTEILGQSVALTDSHLELFAATRAALLGALQALERGEAAATLPEMARFGELRDRVSDAEGADAGEEDVVPIRALFHDDAGPHVLASPLAPAASDGPTAAEEVERFLGLEATGFLDRAEALIGDLPPGQERRFGRVAAQLARLANSVGELSATYGVSAVARAAERAAGELRAATDVAAARKALARLRASLPGAEPEPEEAAGAADPAEAGAAEDVVPVESLLFRGGTALRAALALRPEVERLAALNGARTRELGEKLSELFDLVELGLEEQTTT